MSSSTTEDDNMSYKFESVCENEYDYHGKKVTSPEIKLQDYRGVLSDEQEVIVLLQRAEQGADDSIMPDAISLTGPQIRSLHKVLGQYITDMDAPKMSYPDQLVIVSEVENADEICVEIINHNNNDLLEIVEGCDQAVYLTKAEAEKLLEALPTFIAAMKPFKKAD